MAATDWLPSSVRAAAIERRLNPGQTLFYSGSKSTGFYKVVTGTVRLIRVDRASFVCLRIPRRIHFVRRLTTFSGIISALKRKTCGSAGSTVTRTQWVSGLPKVSTLVKFSKSRLVFLL